MTTLTRRDREIWENRMKLKSAFGSLMFIAVGTEVSIPLRRCLCHGKPNGVKEIIFISLELQYIILTSCDIIYINRNDVNNICIIIRSWCLQISIHIPFECETTSSLRKKVNEYEEEKESLLWWPKSGVEIGYNNRVDLSAACNQVVDVYIVLLYLQVFPYF